MLRQPDSSHHRNDFSARARTERLTFLTIASRLVLEVVDNQTVRSELTNSIDLFGGDVTQSIWRSCKLWRRDSVETNPRATIVKLLEKRTQGDLFLRGGKPRRAYGLTAIQVC